MRYQYLLFDLDGTITDPKEGITKSAQYALEAFGIYEPDADKLTPFIGPPLIDSFQEFYHMPPEQAALAVKKYRERFEQVGWLENLLYDGMDSLLRGLAKRRLPAGGGFQQADRLCRADFKPLWHRRLLCGGGRQRAERSPHQKGRGGAGGAAAALWGVPPGPAHRGDDRRPARFDVEGAKAHQLDSIGVAYGYALPGELQQAGADFIVESVEELTALLMQ